MIPTTEHKLEIRRTYPVTRERIYAAFTDPAEIVQWFRPPEAPPVMKEFDFRVGGRYAMAWKQEDGEIWISSGEYLEIEPPSRLVYTWIWEDDADWPAPSVITVEFLAKPDGVEMIFRHEGLPSAESQSRHLGGWGACFDNLTAHLSS